MVVDSNTLYVVFDVTNQAPVVGTIHFRPTQTVYANANVGTIGQPQK
jgi:hypothetical protein